MRARALEQGGRAEIAPELHIDHRSAKDRHPAPVLAGSAPLFQMRFIEVETMPFEIAIPAVLKGFAVIAWKQAVFARGLELSARSDLMREGQAQALGNPGVDADFDRGGRFGNGQVSPHPKA